MNIFKWFGKAKSSSVKVEQSKISLWNGVALMVVQGRELYTCRDRNY